MVLAATKMLGMRIRITPNA